MSKKQNMRKYVKCY